MKSFLRLALLLACVGGGVWGMLTYAPDFFRPNVPTLMQTWKPAREHTRIQRAACTVGSKTEGIGNCLWQSIPVSLWLLVKFLFLSFVKATYLPAVVIGITGGLLTWILLTWIFGATGGFQKKLWQVFRKPMVVVTVILLVAAIFATTEYQFIPIALLVFAWVVYGLSKLGRHLTHQHAPTT